MWPIVLLSFTFVRCDLPPANRKSYIGNRKSRRSSENQKSKAKPKIKTASVFENLRLKIQDLRKVPPPSMAPECF
ncbi:MAG: hypothetical protein AUG75_11380 [Cyanobacteria bacterium 13_1_20CM_4_61_6]|nr:MAG: hypothetical protein AUG75_11380 [Cyanobacteria bacterium 13_1_20CM_4_61_6]